MSAAMVSALSTPSMARVAGRRVATSATARRVSIAHRAGRGRMVVRVRAAVEDKKEDVTEEISTKATELLENAKTAWDKTEEKPAVVAISVVSFVAIWAASALVEGIDKLPFFGGFFELVGLLVTGWFIYRYLLFGPDREELKRNIDTFFSKVAGK